MTFKDKELEADRIEVRRYWSIGAEVAAKLGITLKQILSPREKIPETNEWLSEMKNESYLFTDDFQGERLGYTPNVIRHKISRHR